MFIFLINCSFILPLPSFITVLKFFFISLELLINVPSNHIDIILLQTYVYLATNPCNLIIKIAL